MKPVHAELPPLEEPERLDDDARVVAAVEEGLADVHAGRVVDDADLDEVLRARLGDLVERGFADRSGRRTTRWNRRSSFQC